MSMMGRGWWLWILLIGAGCLSRAEVGTWRNFTSMSTVRGVVRDGTTFWAATSGGLFQWNPELNSYLLVTSAEGLRSIDLTALAIDGAGRIWTGTSTGILHVYDPRTGSVRYILDIANANQTNKRINSLTVVGDTVLINTAFGLSIFRISRFEFGDTYSRFGSVSAQSRIAVSASTTFDGKLWACVSDGQLINQIAVANLSNPNLLPPESWSMQVVGSPGTVPRTLTVFSGKLYAGATTGLYVYNDQALSGGTWTAVAPLVGSSIVAATTAGANLLVTTEGNRVYALTPQYALSQVGGTLPFPPTSMTDDGKGNPVVGSVLGGLLTLGTSAWNSHLPNGPNSNQFLNITVDPQGVVWCGSGDLTGSGLYRFDGTEWTSFTKLNSSLPANEVHRLSTACNGSVWASTYGRGIVEIPAGQKQPDSAHVFGRNVGMIGLATDPNYIVVSNAVCDGQGNTWMTVVLAADKNLLVVHNADGTWGYIPVIINGIKLTNLQDRPVDRCLAVDAYDNLWMVTRDAAFKGIATLGNRGTIDSTVSNLLTTANGLPSNEVKTIVIDRENDLWVGTDRGIAIVLNVADPSARDAIAKYRPLSGVVVNCIAVDPLNQKWVGTPDGVFLLSSDGTQTLATYTVENTAGKLMDNDVKSIAIDGTSGTVYFATSFGLASLTTPAAAPQASFDELTVYPNPYLVPNTSLLTVSGLVENSSLKILSVDGRVVRSISTPGGLAGFWDGKDESGKDVPSGVYVIVAYAEDGSKVAKTKVAVIRR
jgi:ligand-binding sensor domain-containing protein